MIDFNFKFKNGTLIYEKVRENIGIITPIKETTFEKWTYFHIKDDHGNLLASITGDDKDKETLEVERNEFIAWVNEGKKGKE